MDKSEAIDVEAREVTPSDQHTKPDALPAVQTTTQSVAIPQSYALPSKEQIEEYEKFLKNYDEFIDRTLDDKVDYGLIPGVAKPSLFKPGAEKLEKLLFLTHKKILVERVIEPDYSFVKYTYRTEVYDKAGILKATCEGSCNSKESKYRYTYIKDREITEDQKAKAKMIEKNGQYGSYITWQVEKTDFYDVENTIMKMAQKRSYVGAILEATNSSGRFTQDVEDMPHDDKPANQNNNQNTPPQNNQNQPPRAQNGSPRPQQQQSGPKPMSDAQKGLVDKLQKQKGITDLTKIGFKKKIGTDFISTAEASALVNELFKLPDAESNLPVIQQEQ